MEVVFPPGPACRAGEGGMAEEEGLGGSRGPDSVAKARMRGESTRLQGLDHGRPPV